TPTMGGVLIAGSIFICTILFADLSSFYISMALVCLVWLFVLGVVDDWLKLTSARRKPGWREGLYTWVKLVLQLGLAVLLALFINHYGQRKVTLPMTDIQTMSHAFTIPGVKTWVKDGSQWVPAPHLIVLGTGVFIVLTVLVITGSSNA